VWREYTYSKGFYFEAASKACLKAIEPDRDPKARLTQQTPAHSLFNQSFLIKYLEKRKVTTS
jgi:hypothetical protein